MKVQPEEQSFLRSTHAPQNIAKKPRTKNYDDCFWGGWLRAGGAAPRQPDLVLFFFAEKFNLFVVAGVFVELLIP